LEILGEVGQKDKGILDVSSSGFSEKQLSWLKIKLDVIKDICLHLNKRNTEMDKKIRKIEKTIKKDSHKEEKEMKGLEKADKKRDKMCDMGKHMMEKKKKK
jgi:hypothetical protein